MKSSLGIGSKIAAVVTAALLLSHCGGRQSELGDAWPAYAERFVEAGRVVDRDNGGISHSEGQGYGMLFAEAAGDRERFEQLWRWTRQTLQRSDGLFSWRFRPCPAMDRSCVDDPNNATDGDLLVAWALLRASRRWDHQPWAAAARSIIESVERNLLHGDHGYLFLLPGRDGFVEHSPAGARYRLNLSYYLFPALADFARFTGDPRWKLVAADGVRLLRAARFGERNLHPDWVQLGESGLAGGGDLIYGFNACRIPLHVIWDPSVDRSLLAPYTAFWADDAPPATVDLRSGEGADYPWNSGMAALARTVLARLQGTEPAFERPARARIGAAEGYYAASLAMLSLVALADLDP